MLTCGCKKAGMFSTYPVCKLVLPHLTQSIYLAFLHMLFLFYIAWHIFFQSQGTFFLLGSTLLGIQDPITSIKYWSQVSSDRSISIRWSQLMLDRISLALSKSPCTYLQICHAFGLVWFLCCFLTHCNMSASWSEFAITAERFSFVIWDTRAQSISLFYQWVWYVLPLQWPALERKCAWCQLVTLTGELGG